MRQITRSLLLVVLCCGVYPAQAQDPVKVAPEYYKSILENQRMRLLEVTLEPGAEMPLHSHPDHVAYVLEGGSLNITESGKKAQVHELKAGDAMWLPAQAHSAVNTGKSRIRIAVFELKEKVGM